MRKGHDREGSPSMDSRPGAAVELVKPISRSVVEVVKPSMRSLVELVRSSMRSVVELVTSLESQTEWGSVVEDGRKGRTRREPEGRGVSTSESVSSQKWGAGVGSQSGVKSQSGVGSQ